jgi:hypothetical protein
VIVEVVVDNQRRFMDVYVGLLRNVNDFHVLTLHVHKEEGEAHSISKLLYNCKHKKDKLVFENASYII